MSALMGAEGDAHVHAWEWSMNIRPDGYGRPPVWSCACGALRVTPPASTGDPT